GWGGEKRGGVWGRGGGGLGDGAGVSRILRRVRGRPPPFSENSGASWVRAIVPPCPPAANSCRRSSSARQNCRPRSTSAPRQARSTRAPSSGIVSSQEQIRILRGRSAIFAVLVRCLHAGESRSPPIQAAATTTRSRGL